MTISNSQLISERNFNQNNVQELEDIQKYQPKPKPLLYGSILASCIGAFQFGWLATQLNASNFHDEDCKSTPIPNGKCVIFPGHTDFEWTFVVNAWLVGGAIGALTCALPADKYGRKRVMIFNGMVMIISGIVQATAPNVWVFSLGRFISGVASGSGTVIGTMYIGGIAPTNERGAFVSFVALGISSGILGVATAHFGLDTSSGWKDIVAFPIVLGATQMVLAYFIVVECSRWLLSKNLQEKQQVLICIGICVAQQISGVSAVFYYSSQIFETAGISDPRLGTEIACIVNVLTTFVAIYVMEKFGRKTLLLASVLLMLVSAIGLTLSLNFSISFLSVLFVAFYVIGFAFGLGPITWILISEILPEEIRSCAASLGTLFNWLGNLVIGITYPYISEVLGNSGFTPFIAILLLISGFVLFFIPETRNRSFEEIQQEFDQEIKGSTSNQYVSID